MAWRDSRKSKGKLFLFITAISLGIAALVGITSFRENLLGEIDDQAKTLLGADIEVRDRQPIPDSIHQAFYKLAPEVSYETYFASMVYFPSTDGTRLVQVRALSGKYPYYGRIETNPKDAADRFQQGKYALVDEKLMIQYNVSIGDSLKVGEQQFAIIGRLEKIPGQTDIGATAAPVVYIPFDYLDQTQLVKKGSRVNYINYYMFDPEVDTTGWHKVIQSADEQGYRIDDVEEKKRDTGRAFSDLSSFLELVAFTALLLGCIGVASSMYVYTKEKVGIVATLRCLGMKSHQAISIYLIQVGVFGFIGALIGCGIGIALHMYFPILVQDFVPVDLNPTLSWLSVFSGLGIGIVVSILFALISLVSLRNISPLQAIRSEAQNGKIKLDPLQLLVGAVILLFIMMMVYLQINDFLEALAFTFGLLAAILILGLTGKGLAFLIKKILPNTIPYVWRQGLSNLYRPHNQTSLLITTLGLGTTFIATLLFMQNLLVDRVSIAGSGERPNTVLFDIQSPQIEEVKQLTLDYDLPIMQQVPIVTMRLEEINGIDKDSVLSDTTIHLPDWAYNREYRVTYRDSLIDSENLAEGKWIGEIADPSDSLFISISKGYAENLELKIGDELLFNVQGALIKTYVGSFREIDWRRVQTNFLVLFPKGVLEKAPQFHVLITRINDNELSARYQQAVVRSYPNISIIDLELILKTLEDILGKVAFVIRFMAFFSIGTGILMLISSILLSRFQRMRENVLLRTLGASSGMLWKIIFAEYFFLGALGAFSGVIIATIFTTLLGQFVFEFTFIPDFSDMAWITISVTMVTVVIGLFNSREVISQSPLEVLRRES